MAVIKVVVANGYDELKKIVAESKIRTVIYFSASEDGYGKSWCPDCVSAHPVAKEIMDALLSYNTEPGADRLGLHLTNDLLFVKCLIASREYWKDKENPFRKDEHFKLTCIPTLMEYGDK